MVCTFSVGYSSVSVSSVLYGWANVILRDNMEEAGADVDLDDLHRNLDECMDTSAGLPHCRGAEISQRLRILCLRWSSA